MAGESWRDDALCREVDPELFFPEQGRPTREAKLICMRCGVRTECLEDALRRREKYGVWGGVSERDRRGMIARRREAERNRRAA